VVDGEPYVGVGDLREDGSINFESCRKVSLKAVIKQEQRFSIEVGDIIFGKIGTIGFPQFLPQGIRYALNANTVIIKPKNCPSYVLWLLRSSLVEKQIQIQIHSTSQPAFGIQRIRAMLVPLPDKNERHRISLILDSHNNHITAEESYLAKLKQLKKGFMHDLLTGRVQVTQLMAECEQLDVRSKSVSDCK
jgi:type I restriction enzyme, S subunit